MNPLGQGQTCFRGLKHSSNSMEPLDSKGLGLYFKAFRFAKFQASKSLCFQKCPCFPCFPCFPYFACYPDLPRVAFRPTAITMLYDVPGLPPSSPCSPASQDSPVSRRSWGRSHGANDAPSPLPAVQQALKPPQTLKDSHLVSLCGHSFWSCASNLSSCPVALLAFQRSYLHFAEFEIF